MKKLSFLFILFFASLVAYGQNAATDPQFYVGIGKILPVSMNGQPMMPTVTMDEILADPTLTIPPPAPEILGYSFRMLPNGTEAKMVGPIKGKGAEFTPEIKKMLRDLKGKGCRIFIDEIKVKFGEKEIMAACIVMTVRDNN